VYRLFGSKPGILQALLDVSIAGDDQALSVQERPDVAALYAEPDPVELLAGLAGLTVAINARSSDVYGILTGAAASDPRRRRCSPATSRAGPRARAASPARSPARAHSARGCASATRPTSSTRWRRPSSTACWSSTGAGRRSATNAGSRARWRTS
jgi:hypothetical protein